MGRVMPDEQRKSLDTRKLVAILGRFTSSHDPEALAAARLANRMVREAGLTWEEVIGSGSGPDPDIYGKQQVIEHPERGPLAPPVGRTWKETLRWLCARSAGEDDRENEFLDDLCRILAKQYGYGPPFISPYQAAWVTNIYDRIAQQAE